MKKYIVFTDEKKLESGLPAGVTHEPSGVDLYSITGTATKLPAGSRLATADEYAAAKAADEAKLKAAAKSAAKKAGLAFPSTKIKIPFTEKAALAFIQVKMAFEEFSAAGVPDKDIKSNLKFDELGTVIPVSKLGGKVGNVMYYKFSDVSLWFAKQRNSFYND